jgi:raffinose/stachyose/melibiose transport system substrate-binding protein
MQSKFSEMIGTGKVTPEEVAEAMQKKFEELK